MFKVDRLPAVCCVQDFAEKRRAIVDGAPAPVPVPITSTLTELAPHDLAAALNVAEANRRPTTQSVHPLLHHRRPGSAAPADRAGAPGGTQPDGCAAASTSGAAARLPWEGPKRQEQQTGEQPHRHRWGTAPEWWDGSSDGRGGGAGPPAGPSPTPTEDWANPVVPPPPRLADPPGIKCGHQAAHPRGSSRSVARAPCFLAFLGSWAGS